MSTLEELREKLDQVDDQIVELYEQRSKLTEEVGEYKIRNGIKVFDRQREHDKLQNVAAKATTDFNKKGIREIFEQLMSISRKKQYQQLVEAGALGRLPFIEVDSLNAEHARIVFPGTEGAYSQAAMQDYFGENCNSFYVRTFRDAMESIEEGAADFAVLPIENTTAGAVDEMYDLLVEFENYIVAETIIPITHTLSGLPGTKLSDIERVYSKGVALMQASRYLDEHSDWQQISVANTAIAAKKILDEQDMTQAAVCSAYAAKVHGLELLEDNINDNPNNFTRFIVVTNQKIFLKDAKKISICFEVPHESGSLYHLLSHFIYNDLNMSKIESRPIEGRNWEYRFFVDFEGNLADAAVKNAIRGLREESRSLKILGNY
ncbi:prephenate dehydratase [Faecalicatena contorta]|uniref:prephenate dehydratase n=1 Tax=Lachnospiraceae TaxID=186803 RepID=UPI001F30722C|nr:prephenate dehydratase [Faecalicatena contorta]MCF2667387.1 prephenate dehydratase [Faecalicatena contorta]